MENNIFFRGIFHCYVSFPEGTNITRWLFPKMVVPQDGWFIMENHIKMDDLGGKPFKETPRYSRCQISNQPLWYLGWSLSFNDYRLKNPPFLAGEYSKGIPSLKLT